MSDFHDMDDVDRRITAALHAAAGQVDEHSLRPALSPRASSMPPRRRVQWTAPLLAAAAVVAVVVGTVALTSSGSSSSAPRHIQPGSMLPVPSSPSSVAATPSAPVASGPLGTASAPSSTVSDLPSSASTFAPPPPGCPFSDLPCASSSDGSFYPPIWPFLSYNEAHAWQLAKVKQAAAAQWRADPQATAENFVRDVLGFSDLDLSQLASGVSDAGLTLVNVGFDDASGGFQTAARLELVRYGPALGGVLAPWEVVGAEAPGSNVVITTPQPGALETTPLTVSGNSTGLEGDIVVSVRDQAGALLGQAPPFAAAGTAPPWTTPVSFPTSAARPRLCIAVAVASGPLSEHSRFAIQPFYG